jgi:hypothetical protein
VKSKFILVTLIGFLISFSSIVSAAPAKKPSLNTRTNALEKEVRVLKNKLYTMQNKEAYLGSNLDLFVEMYAHGPAVVTSPALGVRRNAEDASDLMVNLSSMHEDLVLLRLRQKMDRYAKANNIPIPQRPIIALSGGVEGRANYLRDYNSSKSNDVDLSRAELDIVGEAGPWATAAMIISYDNGYDKNVNPEFGRTRVGNSRLFIDRAFVTIGQLEKCPLYFTIGQIFAPFGKYSSYMLTNTSAKILGRVKDRMIVLGLSQAFTRDDASGSLSIQAYGYPGEMKVKDNSLVEHGGFNVDFEYIRGLFSMKVGGSMIGNIAESEGMQTVFNAPSSIKHINMQDRIFGFNGRAKVSFGMFNLLAEYVAAGKRFHPDDLYFYTEGAPKKGAQPKALTAEGAVEFKILGKPNTLAIGYGQTWEALGLGLPRNTLFASYALSFWRNTIFTLEYRRDINYRFDKIGGGGNIEEVRVTDGRNRNTLTAQFGIYF